MKVTIFIECLLPIIGLLVSTTGAANDDFIPVPPTGNCLDITDFSVQWFVDNACNRPAPNQCLFYGQGLSLTAKQYARNPSVDLITIWDIWASYLYDRDNVQSNTMRCIMGIRDSRLLYFEWMSKAMATLCSGEMLYMTPDPRNPDCGGFFGQFEYPTMLDNGLVTKYTSCDKNGGDEVPIPLDFAGRQRTAKRFARDFRTNRFHEPHNTTEVEEIFEQLALEKRGPVDPPNACGSGVGADDDTAAAFDVGGEFPIPW